MNYIYLLTYFVYAHQITVAKLLIFIYILDLIKQKKKHRRRVTSSRIRTDKISYKKDIQLYNNI